MFKRIEELRKALIALVVGTCALFIVLPTALAFLQTKPAFEHFAAFLMLRASAVEFATAVDRRMPPVRNSTEVIPLGDLGEGEYEAPQGGGIRQGRAGVELVAPWNGTRRSPASITRYFADYSAANGDAPARRTLAYGVEAPGLGLPVSSYLVIVADLTCRGEFRRNAVIVTLTEQALTRPNYRAIHEMACTSLWSDRQQPKFSAISTAALTLRGVDPTSSDLTRIFGAMAPELEDGPPIEVGPVKVRAGDALIAGGVLILALGLVVLVETFLLTATRERMTYEIAGPLVLVAGLAGVSAAVCIVFVARLLRQPAWSSDVMLLCAALILAAVAGMAAVLATLIAGLRGRRLPPVGETMRDEQQSAG